MTVNALYTYSDPLASLLFVHIYIYKTEMSVRLFVCPSRLDGWRVGGTVEGDVEGSQEGWIKVNLGEGWVHRWNAWVDIHTFPSNARSPS